MAKISDYTAGSALKDTDLVDVSIDNGDGTYSTRSFTVAQLKAIAENLASADLTQTDSTREYDIVATQLLDFVNGDLKMTKNETNYVYWQDGVLLVRGKADATVLNVLNSANATLFEVGQLSTDVRNTTNLHEVSEDDPDYALGIKGSEVIKHATGRILYKAKISQSGTSDIAVTEIINDTGQTITTQRGSTGSYLFDGFNSLLAGNVEVKYQGNQIDAGCSVKIYSEGSDSSFIVETYDSADALSDGILNEDTDIITHYGTITVIKY